MARLIGRLVLLALFTGLGGAGLLLWASRSAGRQVGGAVAVVASLAGMTATALKATRSAFRRGNPAQVDQTAEECDL